MVFFFIVCKHLNNLFCWFWVLSILLPLQLTFITHHFSFVLLQNATKRHAFLNSFSTAPQSAKYGINQFSDLSQKEFRGMLKFCHLFCKCIVLVCTVFGQLCSFFTIKGASSGEMYSLILYLSSRLFWTYWASYSLVDWAESALSFFFLLFFKHVSLYPGFTLNCIYYPHICTCERALTELLSSLEKKRQRGSQPDLTGGTKQWWHQSRTNTL